MASGQLNTVIRHLLHVAGRRGTGGLSDAQLLERFVRARDEAAFEVLVWRHGGMVLSVCRRLLRREQDAEDAFQATFLALVRKAASIGKREALGSWLYKVAYRVSLRARATGPVQPLADRTLPDRSAAGPGEELLRRELWAALDEEVRRLPEKYRAAFVLCQLEGQTTEAAARTLGCPPGTVGTRLSRARELLRRRLGRHGFGAPALLAAGACAALPAALVGSTIRFGAAGAGPVPARVAALTAGALRAMSAKKLALAAAAVLAVSLLGGGAAFRACQADACEPPPAKRPAPRQRPGVVLRWKFEAGRPFYQEVTTETLQTMKVMNNDVKQTQKQTFYLRWEPVERRGDTWVLKQKVEGVAMNIDIGGSKIQYDSTKESTATNPLGELFKALVGAEFTVTLDLKKAEVTGVEGRKKFLDDLVKANPQMKPLFDQVLSEKALQEMMAEQTFAALREGPARPGDFWVRDRRLDLGPVGAYESKYIYTYRGRDRKDHNLDRIDVATTVRYKGPGRADGVGGLPFTIKNADLKSSNARGALLFDRRRGRVACLELHLTLQGKLAINIGGQDTEVELSQTQKTTVKTTDANPVLRAAARGEEDELRRLRQENERLRRQLEAIREALRGAGKKE